MDPKLKAEAKAAQVLIANLKDILDSVNDDALFEDMIEGETELKETCNHIVSVIQSYEEMAKGLGALVEKYQARKTRLNDQAQRMRAMLATALDMAELKTLQLSAGTLTHKIGPPQLIIDDDWTDKLPADYIVQGVPRIDRTALKKALKDGEEIACARLSNGSPTVAIRTK